MMCYMSVYIHISLHIFWIICAIIHPGGNGDISKNYPSGCHPISQKQHTHTRHLKLMEWLRKVMPALFMTSRIGGDSHAIMTAWRFQEDPSFHLFSRSMALLSKPYSTIPFLQGTFNRGLVWSAMFPLNKILAHGDCSDSCSPYWHWGVKKDPRIGLELCLEGSLFKMSLDKDLEN